MGTREQLELEYEEQISEWKAKAGDAEELNAQLSEARGELSGTRAQLESRVTQMEAMQAEREEMRVSAKSREATLAEQEAQLREYQATIEANEVAIAEHTQKSRQMRAALKAQEKIIAVAGATRGGVPSTPTSGSGGRLKTVTWEEHEKELARLRQTFATERDEAAAAHASALSRLGEFPSLSTTLTPSLTKSNSAVAERQCADRLDEREREASAARERERQSAAAELEEWKHHAASLSTPNTKSPKVRRYPPADKSTA